MWNAGQKVAKLFLHFIGDVKIPMIDAVQAKNAIVVFACCECQFQTWQLDQINDRNDVSGRYLIGLQIK